MSDQVAQGQAERNKTCPGDDINLAAARTEAEWLARLDEIADELAEATPQSAEFTPLGAHHAAFFAAGSDTLIVTFETISTIRETPGSQRPMGYEIARNNGWSSLTVLARSPRWYRDSEVWDYFDEMIDSAFFDGFTHVVFAGAGMNGYAAAAFSVAAPGATVLAIAPQATIAPDVAGWDRRFSAARRFDFTSRFGYAPEMIEGARAVYIVYDPTRRMDAMHAALFRKPFVSLLRARVFDKDTAAALSRMGIMKRLVEAAGRGQLNPHHFHRLLRRRRNDLTYLDSLVEKIEDSQRPRLTAMAANKALTICDSESLHKALARAERRLVRA